MKAPALSPGIDTIGIRISPPHKPMSASRLRLDLQRISEFSKLYPLAEEEATTKQINKIDIYFQGELRTIIDVSKYKKARALYGAARELSVIAQNN